MKAQVDRANIIFTKNERPNKINFISMRSKATKIIFKTCKSFFTVRVSRETIFIKCDNIVKKRELVISAHFNRKGNILMKGIDIKQELLNLLLIKKNTKSVINKLKIKNRLTFGRKFIKKLLFKRTHKDVN